MSFNSKNSTTLKTQGRFRHLTEQEIMNIQKMVDAECKRLGIE